MNSLDLLIVLIVIFFIILGIRDGFFKKIYGILGFWIGLVVATKLMYLVGAGFSESMHIRNEIGHILAFTAIFLIFVLLENLVFRYWGTPGHKSLNVWTRTGGGLIGALQGLMVMSLILVMLSILRLPSEKVRKESELYSSVLHIAPTAFNVTVGWTGDSKGFLEMLQDNFRTIKLP